VALVTNAVCSTSAPVGTWLHWSADSKPIRVCEKGRLVSWKQN